MNGNYNIEQKKAIEILYEEKCSCVVLKDGEYRIFRQRGVNDLYGLVKTGGDFLSGAFIADKVVGKAAAALMALGKAGGVFAVTISGPACCMLAKHGIPVAWNEIVPHIINRAGTGWCPMETACANATTPEECLDKIEETLARIAAGSNAGNAGKNIK